MLSEKVQSLQKEIDAFVVSSKEALELYRLKFISKKGELASLFEELKSIPSDQKKSAGQLLNELKKLAEAKFREISEGLETNTSGNQEIDLSLPTIPNKIGNLHPLTLTLFRIIEVFERLGFSVADGPEIEDDWHNFSALNFPDNHPAREMQDTFFVEKNPDMLLRTHTSNVQIRLMEKQRPPIRAIMPGRVYRNEAISARAHCFFHQVEGLYVNKNVSFADLKQTLYHFAMEM
jgi:phenylalanyl-tRNA synthetase alpha chain